MAAVWGLGLQELFDPRRGSPRLRSLLGRLGEAAQGAATSTESAIAPTKSATARRRPRRTGKDQRALTRDCWRGMPARLGIPRSGRARGATPMSQPSGAPSTASRRCVSIAPARTTRA